VLLLSGQPIADALGIVDVEQLAATHPRASLPLATIASQPGSHDPLSDPEQPRYRRSPILTVGLGGLDRRHEHVRGQIRGHIAVADPGGDEPFDRVDVLTV
jgi:hypothetical protein